MRNSERLAEVIALNSKRAMEFNSFMQREFAHHQQQGESNFDTAERLLLHYKQLAALHKGELVELSTLWKIAIIARQLQESNIKLNTLHNSLAEVITALEAICKQNGLNIVEITRS